MSSRSIPISAHRFAEAIRGLPLENLHIKATELSNSIVHLVSSNKQLQPFADDDQDCADAIKENERVIKRMENRISLLKSELKHRGFIWGDQDGELNIEAPNGCVQNDGDYHPRSQQEPTVTSERHPHARSGLSDEELARLLRERIVEEEGIEREEDGVHL